MPQIEIGLGSVVGDEHLAVLERTHRSGVDVDVRIEFLQVTLKPRPSRIRADRCRRESLAERRDDSTRDEDVLGPALTYACSVGLRQDPGHAFEVGGRVDGLGTKIGIDDDDRIARPASARSCSSPRRLRGAMARGGSVRGVSRGVGVDALVLGGSRQPALAPGQGRPKIVGLQVGFAGPRWYGIGEREK